MNDEGIGRVKTVWVSHEGHVISTVIARINISATSRRISYEGAVTIEKRVKEHFEKVILKHIDDILFSLKFPLNSFIISVVNIGAASTSNVPVSVIGYSIDISVFLALLSASLNLPVSQNIVFTGHIGSIDGDILPIENFAEKCNAAINDKHINALAYPNIDSDISLVNLMPKEYEKAKAAIRSCRGRLKLFEINNTLDLVQKTIPIKDIVTSSLYKDYFIQRTRDSVNKSGDLIANYFRDNNEKNFWEVLKDYLFHKDFKKGKQLLNLYIQYHLKSNKYPLRFGKQLLQLVATLPIHIKIDYDLSTLVPKKDYLAIIKWAKNEDYDDISLLHNALFNQIQEFSTIENKNQNESKKLKQNNILDHILEQLDSDYIDRYILRDYDEARARYSFSEITAKNNEEFVEAITAFYAHMYHHTHTNNDVVDKKEISIEAIEILSNTFSKEGGYKAALAEAKNGTRGRLLSIFDKITEHLKEEARRKHIFATFQQSIDPLNFDKKVEIIKQIIERSQEDLSQEIINQPAEKFADDYEQIIEAFVNSKTILKNILRRL